MQTALNRDLGERAHMIRVAVVDDHHAIRAGVESAAASQPGIVCVGTAADAEQLAPLLYRARPDVVVLDYHLPRIDGLQLCRQIKRDVLAPAVVVYTAYADASLTIPSIMAGADALVDKSAPARELFEAIRCVASGGTSIPPPIPELVAVARGSLDAADLPIFDRPDRRHRERRPRSSGARAAHRRDPRASVRTRRSRGGSAVGTVFGVARGEPALSPGPQLAQHVVQDPAVAEVPPLVRGVDAHARVELDARRGR